MTTSGDGEPALRAEVARWSAALREVEVLEPWLTESHWDEHYWDDVAEQVADDPRSRADARGARDALEDALRRAFPGASLVSENGLYRDRLGERLDRVVGLVVSRRSADRRPPRSW
ncbi:hypothetical protein [Cellulomonas chitinilytica]|uniref:hypothetical protein n=1 Tax=Cellulomonas chitinilytica TaxID=398759 RepID=UPI0019409277|nr:hypothetical protein [Cellulomonas chitinilytica]